MTSDLLGKGARVAIIVTGVVAGLMLLYFGRAVFEPLVFAAFLIALSGPMMLRLSPRIGRVPALLVVLVATIAVVLAFCGIIFWGIQRVTLWTIGHLPQFETAYRELERVLADNGVALSLMMPEQFNPRLILAPVLALLSHAQELSGFLLLIFVFTILGLVELKQAGNRLARVEARKPSLHISTVCQDVSGKFGRYMSVRLVVSIIDTIICYLFFRLIGLDEPLAWALLVGTFNFIPFIGPLIVAIGLGFFAAAQYGDLWMVFVAVAGTTLINFVLGSNVEPLMAGSALKMSPVLVLFGVFFWAVIWGIPGAFIGVQMMILMLSILAVIPSTRWLAELLGGAPAEEDQAKVSI